MPTLNSERTLRIALTSICRQSLPASEIEVLVADGGSTDATRPIAEAFGCTVLENPQVLPEYGKSIGLAHARGRFGVFLDSDEELTATDSLESKIRLLDTVSTVHSVITAGLSTPLGYGVVSDYVNRYGDPFSYFLHRLDGGDYMPDFRHRCNVVFEDQKAAVFAFDLVDVLPICDGGGHFFRLEHLRQMADVTDPRVVPRVFQMMAAEHRQIGIVKGDFVRHYSTSTFRGLMRKIHWRIVGNVHYAHTEMTGQAASNKAQTRAQIYQKYAFIPYSFTLLSPLVDALHLMIRHRNPGYALHFPLTVLTAFDIACQVMLRIAGVRPKWGSYS